MTTNSAVTQLGIKQYNKDICPGWRPGVYPIAEYEELMKVWLRITLMEEERIGAIIYSRLELGALDLARRFQIKRYDGSLSSLTHEKILTGIDALCCPHADEIRDSGSGTLIYPATPAGYAEFLTSLIKEFKTEDQDQAWIALNQFFSLDGHSMDFFEYDQRFQSRYENACLLYTSPSPRDGLLSRMPSSA